MVSTRPQHSGRGKQDEERYNRTRTTFQPAPSTPAGGNLATVPLRARRPLFQLAPSTPTGGNPNHLAPGRQVEEVSTRPQHSGRGKQAHLAGSTIRGTGN